jgi:putative RNA 2'-phosphotransferase
VDERKPKKVIDQKRISKLLSLILRHRPDEFGLNMNDFGFIPLAEVLEAVQQRNADVTSEDIEQMVGSSRQKRFEITDGAIRALYGHSFFVEMDGEPMEPPEYLYMGTTSSAVRKMQEEGMRPVDRFYLHLSMTREVAESRSRQVGGPCVIEVRARQAADEGEIKFFARGEVVLSREVPADYVGDVYGFEEGAVEERPAPPRRPRPNSGSDARSQSTRQSRPLASPRPRPKAEGEAAAEIPAAPSYGRKPRKATGRR